MDWFLNHLSTIVIGLLLFGVVALIIRSMRKKRRLGQSSCGCGCSGCAMKENCHGGK